MKIIKRNKQEIEFDKNKIANAIRKANESVPDIFRMTERDIEDITDVVTHQCMNWARTIEVEEVQDLVEAEIMRRQFYEVSKSYITYRYKRELSRKQNTTDDAILSLIERENEELKQENSNKNPTLNSTVRDYIAGEVSKDLTRRVLLDDEIMKAHDEGIIHFHDADYFVQSMSNCAVWNLEDMLQNGTVISGIKIEKPHSFATACNIATQIVAQIASNQYGGQTFSLAHLAPFVDISRQKHIRKIRENAERSGVPLSQKDIERMAEFQVKDEIKAGVQTIQYQLVTLMTTNGQTPFVSMYMYINEAPEGRTRGDLAMIIEEVLTQRMEGLPNETGHKVVAAFPKLLYVLDENNVRKGSTYYYLTELAAKCTAKTMVPDYISAKIMRELKNGDVYGCMGCRSFLTPDRFTEKGIGNISKALNYKEGEHKYYGRFNQGVVTINLVDVACSSDRDMDKFWEILDDRLELCHKALQKRHKRLLGTVSDVAPVLWQYGALARFEKGEVIDPLLFDGYSTISLGYAGIYEMTYFMTGESHTEANGKEFALKVMQHLNDKCTEWKLSENIDYSLYGTPIESTTYKFAKCLKKRFGVIPEVTDHNYITNSYHINVREEINAFDKLSKEAEFQRLSPGGAISYIEVPDMRNNIPAVLSVIEFIYNTIMYAEINTKSDYCQVCGFEGEIEIKNKNDKLIWKCPCCGNEDQNKMNVARRTCGYIGTQFWNQGRTEEIKERVLHL